MDSISEAPASEHRAREFDDWQIGTSSCPCPVETPVIDFGIVRPSLGRTVQRFLRITCVFASGLSGEAYEPCPDFAFSGPSRTFALAAGHSEQWGVVFTPGGTDVGDRTCTLNLDRTGTSSCPIVQCTATVRSTPGTAAPLTLAFPPTRIGESRDLTFTINSTSPISGTVSVPCSEFSVVGSPTYDLASGGSATFTIRYTPTTVGLASEHRFEWIGIARASGCTAPDMFHRPKRTRSPPWLWSGRRRRFLPRDRRPLGRKPPCVSSLPPIAKARLARENLQGGLEAALQVPLRLASAFPVTLR